GVKRKDQVFAAPVGAGDRAIDQAPTRVDSGWSFENLRKCRIDLDGRDRLVDDMRGDQASDGFDFGKLWHTLIRAGFAREARRSLEGREEGHIPSRCSGSGRLLIAHCMTSTIG